MDKVIRSVDPTLYSKDGLKQDLGKPLPEAQESHGLLSVLRYYEPSFLVILFLCNYAQGFKQFLDLSLMKLYKDEMQL